MNEQERVERFEAAFNRIDRALNELAERKGDGRRRQFSSKVRIGANKLRRLARYKDFLLEIGELRNAIVHNRFGDDHYIAVPSEETVVEMERIERRMFSPQRVLPTFQRPVITLQADQSLLEAWTLVRNDGYSRFPVYDQRDFVGLLTSNGFARWAASQIDDDGALHIDTAEARVADVLAEDHRRDRVQFISKHAYIDDADDMYSSTPGLEAIIITEHGKPHESPLGLICAADVAALES